MSQRPPVVINLIGPPSPAGRDWCATCVMLYIGDISASQENQAMAMKRVEQIRSQGLDEVDLLLDSSLTWRKLNLAVTVAPSVYFQVPMPVCWVHVQGYDPEKASQASSQPTERLVNGREKNEVRTRRSASG